MADPVQLVSEIDEYVGGTSKSAERLKYLAEEYARCRKLASERLRHTVEHLRKGQRSEALRVASQPPRILEFIAALELRQPEIWERLCAREGLPLAAAPSEEMAAELNEAYAAEHAVEPLLRQFRRQALEAAPLEKRLRTLRALLELEPSHPGWRDDVEAHERVRQDQILQASVMATKRQDLPALDHLVEELTESDWRFNPPADVMREVRARLFALRSAQARENLQGLWRTLDEAYAAMDQQEAGALLRESDRLLAENHLTPPAERQERLAAVRHWLENEQTVREQQQRFEQACFELSQQLEAQVQRRELISTYEGLKRFGLPVPEELDSRYRAAIAHQQRRERRRRRLVAGATVLVLAGALTAAVVAVQAAVQEARFQKEHAALVEMIELGEVDEAQVQWTRLTQGAQDPSRVARLSPTRQRLEELLASERRRSSDRRRWLTQARALLEQAGLVHPTTEEALAQPSALPELLQQVDGLITKANAASQGVEELAAVEEVRTQLAGVRHRWQSAVDRRFSERLLRVARQVQQLTPELLETDPQQFSAIWKSVAPEVKRMGEQTQVSQMLRQDVEPLRERLTALGAQLQDHLTWLQEQESLEQIATATTSVDAYVHALEQFVEQYPQSPRSLVFRDALAQKESWGAVAAWQALWQAHPPRKPTASENSARREAIRDYLKRYPRSPFTGVLHQLQHQEQTLARWLAADGPWKGALQATLASDLLIQIDRVVVAQKDGPSLVYYVASDSDVQVNDRRVWFRAILSRVRTNVQLRSYPADALMSRGTAPQVLVAEEIRKRIARLTESKADTFGLALTRLVRDWKGLDPILKAVLLEEILQLMAAQDVSYREQAAQVLEELRSLEAGTLDWMNPEPPGLDRARERIEQALAETVNEGRLAAMEVSAKAQRQTLEQMLQVQVVGMAVMRQDQQQWRLETHSAPLPDGAGVYYLRGGRGSGEDQLVRVGEVRDGRPELTGLIPPMVPEGTLAFVLQGELR